MKFFLSGELDHGISEACMQIEMEIEPILNTLENTNYGSEVVDIGIIPIIIDPKRGLLEEGFFKERKLFKRKTAEADFRLRIDYNKFKAADYEKRKLLLLNNIVESIKILGQRARKDFDHVKLMNDIYKLFDINEETLMQL
ncbi:MAG: dihydrolipoamide succinyltransferase [Chloroflexi bacterium]|jgi:hypothetical protein|nr:dihydrolipoamide succinyltransferase [Chloroflexota bacterium]MBT7081225.1 dihydrolipoamide succinyltransferase [Chloroflexota bacterium]MBT7290112.1 dihydrolipoamide succinyltransferase [Chloroflexota bacterium]